MLHIVKQYRKMIFSFLENNLNGESTASEVSSKLDSNSDKRISKKEMKDALNDPQLSEEVKNIISSIESKIKNFQHIGDFEKSYTARFNNLKSKQLSQVADVAADTKSQVADVAADTKSQVADVAAEMNDLEALDLLSDLNSDSDLDDQNVLDEANLKTTLSQLSNGGNKAKLLQIYENVTGNNVDAITKENVGDFHEKFVFNIRFMQGLGYANGAYALLDGKMDDFVSQVPKGSKLENSNIDKLSPGVQNAVGALVSTGVLIFSQGIVTVSNEEKQYDGNKLVEEVEKSKDGEPLSKLKQVLTFIKSALNVSKDLFTGREGSLFSIGEDATINVRKFEEAITKFAIGVLDLKLNGNDTNFPEGLTKEKYDETIRLSKKYGLDIDKPEDIKLIQGILIQDFILSEANRRQGTDWKFTLSWLFIGFHRDKIGVETAPLESDKEQEQVERGLTKKTLDSKVLESIGISVTKDGEKFEHTLPEEGSMISLPGDDRKFPIKEIKPEGIRDKLTNSDIKYDFHFSFVGGRGKDYYTLTLTPSPSNESGASGDVGKQEIYDVRNLRTGKDLNTMKLNEKQRESINFGEALYSIGHDVNFGKLVKLISSGDKEGVRSELTRLSEIKGQVNTNKLAKSLLSNIDNFAEWDSYMSGNSYTRKLRSPKFDTVRTEKIIGAEIALAKALGFPNPSSESNFKVSGQYKSKQISEVLSGQEITSVQFMTPVDNTSREDQLKSRSALHRVSVVDGSFAISEKSQEVSDPARKKSIVDGLLKSSHESRAIQNQLDKLNKFLGKKGNVSLEQYKSYLVSGNIDDLKVSGLKLQKGKETRFLEARAMVAGNVCLNATYAIAYPAFEFEGGNKQNIDTVVTSDASATTNIELSKGSESGIGINPAAAVLRFRNGGGKTNGSGGKNTSTPGVKGGGDNGGAGSGGGLDAVRG
ncbi:MAG: hypothetical protein PHI37_05180 [Candidatus Gracilibacteria bacterium]|nr:hypothetical protein [Candidatus Gracilibacteria bacterium]